MVWELGFGMSSTVRKPIRNAAGERRGLGASVRVFVNVEGSLAKLPGMLSACKHDKVFVRQDKNSKNYIYIYPNEGKGFRGSGLPRSIHCALNASGLMLFCSGLPLGV